MKNHSGPWGGCCTAAAYLSHFVNDGVKWAHIDIAGPAGVFPNKNGTGFGVGFLFDFFCSLWYTYYLTFTKNIFVK